MSWSEKRRRAFSRLVKRRQREGTWGKRKAKDNSSIERAMVSVLGDAVSKPTVIPLMTRTTKKSKDPLGENYEHGWRMAMSLVQDRVKQAATEELISERSEAANAYADVYRMIQGFVKNLDRQKME